LATSYFNHFFSSGVMSVKQGTITLVDEQRTGVTGHLGDQRSVRSTPMVEAPGGRDRGEREQAIEVHVKLVSQNFATLPI
jgi:hypothetical protein